jgi:hypothetical protein
MEQRSENSRSHRYTVSAVICSPDQQPRWSGQVEVEAANVKEATEAGRQKVDLTIPHAAGDLIQVLRVQQHSETFSNGEVDGLAEFGADFSQDRLYRYGLYRIWDKSLPPAMVIGLNPSTADERLNDPTVRRCLRFAKDLGYGGLFMTNAFAFRATSPKMLQTIADPVGPDNDAWLARLSQRASIVIAAWGNHGAINGRGRQIRDLLPVLHHFGLTGSGEPKHPLYLPASSKPLLWT